MIHRPPLQPPMKRGHNYEFALTEAEGESVIRVTKAPLSKAILILAMQGFHVSEITSFNVNTLNMDIRLSGIPQSYFDILVSFAEGFAISEVAVWRRTKKALLNALEKGVIHGDPDRLPFPAALRYKKDPEWKIAEELIWAVRRMHVLNGGYLDTIDPVTSCRHTDCKRMRDLIGEVKREREQRIQ